MIRSIIIDDEAHCRKTLSLLLGEYCPGVLVVEQCENGQQGIEAIRKFNPDVVFLDIEMPHMNGFEMLERLGELNFAIVFTTGYDQYAIKAFRISALDYLLKPIEHDELRKAVAKIRQQSAYPSPEQMELFLQQIRRQVPGIQKVALPTMEGFQMVALDTIISCESASNYSVLLLKNKQKLVISRTLKETEEVLAEHSFLRVHNSSIVNLNEINKYIKGEGGYLIMSDGSTVAVSRSRKESLLKRIKPDRQ